MADVVPEWFEHAVAPDSALIQTISRRCSLCPIAAELLLRRGYVDDKSIDFFFSTSLSLLSDPSKITGMDSAAKRIAAGIVQGEAFEIHGDYDVDGITATTLLHDLFTTIGVDSGYFIPDRQRDGYGLSMHAIKDASERGVTVIVSVDNGISAVEEAAYTKTLGIDLIVTDHHQPPAQLPEAYSLVNPLLDDNVSDFHQLSGVGVAFFLAIAVRRELRKLGWFADRVEPDLRNLLDLVALGTVADQMTLVGVNRILVKAGLKLLSTAPRRPLAALIDQLNLNTLNAGTIVFQIAPRINAVGRMDHAAKCVEFLCLRDDQQPKEYLNLLERCNTYRREIEDGVFNDAVDLVDGNDSGDSVVDSNILVLVKEGWHQGVIGIVASRLVEIYSRPVILIALSDGVGKGSGRSVPGVDLHGLLRRASRYLQGYGGHKAAVGLTVSEEHVAQFAQDIWQNASSMIAEPDLVPKVGYDLELTVSDINWELVANLEPFTPFGMGNPEPLFCIKGRLIDSYRILKEKHLSFSLKGGGVRISCVGFGMAGSSTMLVEKVDILGHVRRHFWNGRDEIQIIVKGLRPHQEL